MPLTLGLGPLVAVMQTRWLRTKDERWLRLTHFFGTLFLINFAIGVATGLVQEFEFGMNWSVYSKFVGNVFGAPLAIEGLAAFAVESTFLGLWIFGWDRLSPRLHLATLWIAVLGTWMSAYFILVANSWMQHPVGYKLVNGEAQLTSVWALLSNSFALRAYLHTMLAGLIFGSIVTLGVCCWHFLRGHQVDLFRLAAKLALIVAVPATLLQLVVGNRFGEAVTSAQSMKIAASEAQWNTCQPCGFSLFQIGGFTTQDQTPSFSITIPKLLSYMATGSFDGKVQGLNQLQQQSQRKFGRGDYMPNIEVIYWSMRVMAFAGVLMFLVAALGAWLYWRKKLERARWFHLDGDRRVGPALHRRDRGLDPDRDGTSAVDRQRPAQDGGRELARGQYDLGRDQPVDVRGALRAPARARHLADATLRAPRPASCRRIRRVRQSTARSRLLTVTT